MNILIKNIDEIYTGVTDKNLTKNCNIIIKNNSIYNITPSLSSIKEKNYDYIIDGKGKIALPGFINTHTHAGMTLLRGYADDLPLHNWLQNKIWPFEANLSKEEIYWGSKLAILEMLSTGTTTFTDMYIQMDIVAKALEETGMRAVLTEGLIEKNDGIEGLKSSLNFCNKWWGQANGRITTMLAPHAPYTCSKKYLEQIINLSEVHDLAINIHVAETKKEYEDSLKGNDLSPISYLDSFGFFERPVLAAHCVYLSAGDIKILVEKNVGVAYNPASNMKLSSGIANIVDMINSGVNVAFGTDSVASNNNLDLIEEARMGSYLQKVNSNNPTVLNIDDLFKMLTYNGAKALGLKKVGKIQKDFLADIVLVDTKNSTHFYPHHNNLSNLFYSGNGSDVNTVIINGKIVYDNNEFLTIDKEKVYYEVEKIIEKKAT